MLLRRPATSAIYTLSLHDALPILRHAVGLAFPGVGAECRRPELIVELRLRDRHLGQDALLGVVGHPRSEHLLHVGLRSEEHTSELQSHVNLVCRLLLEKQKITSKS